MSHNSRTVDIKRPYNSIILANNATYNSQNYAGTLGSSLLQSHKIGCTDKTCCFRRLSHMYVH